MIDGKVSGLAYTVLIVEDDPDLRAMLDQLLFLEGFNTLTAENGSAALGLLRQPPRPNVILLDLMMPIMDGWGFRERQRSDAELSSIPVVILSAIADRATSLEAAAILPKPLNFDQLVTVVRSHCGP
jgi:DNA-binding response OmpR family regulator